MMDIEIIILSKSEKEKYHMISLLCKIYIFLKDTNEFIYKTEVNIYIKNKLMVTKEKTWEGEGRDKSGAWDELERISYIRERAKMGGFLVVLMVKNPLTNAGDIRYVGLIPGLGRFPGGGHSNPLQCSCLEDPMDRRAWQTIYSP